MPGDLVQLIYTSKETQPFPEADLHALLANARHNNHTLGVSGILLYEAGSFLQVLEGSEVAVDTIYAQVCKDPRHAGLNLLMKKPIKARDFGDWTMGYAGLTREQIQAIDGMNDFFDDGHCYIDLNAGQAKAILTRFLNGRWPKALIA